MEKINQTAVEWLVQEINERESPTTEEKGGLYRVDEERNYPSVYSSDAIGLPLHSKVMH